MDFANAEQLLVLCEENKKPISWVMRQREHELTGASLEEIEERMKKAYRIMEESAHAPLEKEIPSIGGLIGGEAARLEAHRKSGNSLFGGVLARALCYSMAVLEVNASMGLIVAAPTAGSSGVVPGLLLALKEEKGLSEEEVLNGLFTAGAVGYLLMKNASVSGAEAGCQAEVGSASAMAAAAAVEIFGGSPRQCFDAAAMALANLLGLVCDPVAGLVESPCQSRNGVGVSNALISAEIILSGARQLIPFTEMAQAMYEVGKSLPYSLRETALGGCAATPTGCARSCQIFGCTKS